MPFVSIDALPRGQALINTDQVTYVREEGEDMVTTIYFADGGSVRTPHPLSEAWDVLEGREPGDDGSMPIA